MPSMANESEWQTPHAWALIKTSPALGISTGTSWISSLAPFSLQTAALQVFGIFGAMFEVQWLFGSNW